MEGVTGGSSRHLVHRFALRHLRSADFDSGGGGAGLTSLLLIQVFPAFLGFIALFVLLLQIGVVIPAAGINTHIGLILVYLGGAIGFNAFLLKGFMDSIPNSLDESAKVDGATSWQVFWGSSFPSPGRFSW